MSSRLGHSREAKKKIKYTEEIEPESDGTSSELSEGNHSGGKKGKGKKAANESSEEEDDSDAFEPKKKSKPKRGKGKKGKKGKKDQVKRACPFDLLPLELVTEVLSRLHSKDILAFSRTNKYYRSLLTSKARSKHIWKVARRRLGLPALTAGDLSEPAYAALLWDTRCDFCHKDKYAYVEPYLRVRICKACRKLHMMRIDGRHGKDSLYSSAALACVAKTPCTPSDLQWSGSTVRSALVRDLDHYTEKISTLQRADEADKPLQSATSGTSTIPGRCQSRRENLRTNVGAPASYDDNGYHAGASIRAGGSVVEFVEEREAQVDKIFTDGLKIETEHGRVVREMEQEESRIRVEIRRARANERKAFENSVEERLGFSKRYGHTLSDTDNPESDVEHVRGRTPKKSRRNLPYGVVDSVFREGEPLTDERWTAIKPKILKKIEKARERERSWKRQQQERKRLLSRQQSSRPYYDSLKASFPKSTLFPIFVDFLLLPSVKPLWERTSDEDDSEDASTVDEGSWKLLLPLIKAEVEEYHLDFVTTAVRLILSAHQDFRSDDELEEAVQATLASDLDAFFSLASSLVLCEECRGKMMTYKDTNSFWPTTIWGGFIGSFSEVVAHLHEKHSSLDSLSHLKSEATIPICLPLQVASTISALLEVGDYSPSQATVRDLDQLDSGRYEWENYVGRKHFYNWRKLIDTISYTAFQAETKHPKDPIHLPAPTIVYYPPPSGNRR